MSRTSDVAMRWLASPRVIRLLDEEALVRALVAIVSLPSEIVGLRERCARAVARALGLATSDQAALLEHTLRRVEGDIGRLKSRLVRR